MGLTLTEWLLIGIFIVNLWFFLVINHNQCEEYKWLTNISSGNVKTRQEIERFRESLEISKFENISTIHQQLYELRYLKDISTKVANVDDRLRKIERELSDMNTTLASLYSIEKRLESLDYIATVWIEKSDN